MTSAADVIAAARTQLGDPYLFGATGPNAWDCSGLLQWAYKQVGISIPRTTYAMVDDKQLGYVSRADIAPGDLLFFSYGPGKENSHVAMWTGDGKIIQSGSGGVKEFTFSNWSQVSQIRRVPGIDGYTTPHSETSLLQRLLGIIPDPLNPVGSAAAAGATVGAGSAEGGGILGAIGSGILSIAQSALSVGQLAGLASRAFLPTNLLRGFLFIVGIMFLLIGIWFVGQELKD